MDSGSIDNLVSIEMVEKLSLERIQYEMPYRAFGLRKCQWFDVLEKTYVHFKIGDYYDTVECDIMPLRDCHLILGRAWQYDNKTLYNAHKNTYTISKNGEIFLLTPFLEEDDLSWKETRSLGLIDKIVFLEHEEQEVVDKEEEVVHSSMKYDDEQAEVYILFEGQEQQVNAGVETESEQQKVVVEPCEEKVLADEGEMVTGMVEEIIFLDDGYIDTNYQKGKDVVQRSDAEEKTIDERDEIFVDHCDALEIYKQEEAQIEDQVDWYFYAGDMRLSKVFVPRFKKDTMKGIHSTIWNQHVLASSINLVILMVTLLPLYNWKI